MEVTTYYDIVVIGRCIAQTRKVGYRKGACLIFRFRRRGDEENVIREYDCGKENR